MPNETPFQIALILAVVAFLGVRVYYRQKTGTLHLILPQDNRMMLRILLLILLLTLLVMLLWLINPNWLRWSALSLPGWLRWSGLALALIAAALLSWVHHTLGAGYSPALEIQEQHKLITTGPYRRVRHPMYSVIILWLASLSLIMANWLILLAPLAFALFAILRAPNEEKMLVETFGEAYRDYMKKTGRFLPPLLG